MPPAPSPHAGLRACRLQTRQLGLRRVLALDHDRRAARGFADRFLFGEARGFGLGIDRLALVGLGRAAEGKDPVSEVFRLADDAAGLEVDLGADRGVNGVGAGKLDRYGAAVIARVAAQR